MGMDHFIALILPLDPLQRKMEPDVKLRRESRVGVFFLIRKCGGTCWVK